MACDRGHLRAMRLLPFAAATCSGGNSLVRPWAADALVSAASTDRSVREVRRLRSGIEADWISAARQGNEAIYGVRGFLGFRVKVG
jgi:hypothetical protein